MRRIDHPHSFFKNEHSKELTAEQKYIHGLKEEFNIYLAMFIMQEGILERHLQSLSGLLVSHRDTEAKLKEMFDSLTSMEKVNTYLEVLNNKLNDIRIDRLCYRGYREVIQRDLPYLVASQDGVAVHHQKRQIELGVIILVNCPDMMVHIPSTLCLLPTLETSSDSSDTEKDFDSDSDPAPLPESLSNMSLIAYFYEKIYRSHAPSNVMGDILLLATLYRKPHVIEYMLLKNKNVHIDPLLHKYVNENTHNACDLICIQDCFRNVLEGPEQDIKEIITAACNLNLDFLFKLIAASAQQKQISPLQMKIIIQTLYCYGQASETVVFGELEEKVKMELLQAMRKGGLYVSWPELWRDSPVLGLTAASVTSAHMPMRPF